MTSTPRTARCGPACRVVWQGRRLRAAPYADCSVAFCLELKWLLARMTFCKISRALLVQMNGLGLVLW